jgi:hypothetical protein
MAEPTPTPWVDDNTREYYGKRVVRHNGLVVCIIPDSKYADEDARRIVATPLMLEMLKRCVERIQYWENPINVVSAVQLDALDLIAEMEGR